jgi:hypothetical protein
VASAMRKEPVWWPQPGVVGSYSPARWPVSPPPPGTSPPAPVCTVCSHQSCSQIFSITVVIFLQRAVCDNNEFITHTENACSGMKEKLLI